MTEADRIFAEFPDYIREFIYRNGWTELRQTQIDAARVILQTDDNLLLSSPTASGKTEAAFFPVLADLERHADTVAGVQVLYIAPLKSLINDQFLRLDELLDMSGVPVCHWHGDVSASHKTRLLKDPRGILQITPESLESLLINRSSSIHAIFGALRFVILDEIHTMIGSDRGNQILCQLCRLARAIGHHPRRIGLSATVGDLRVAAAWLGSGSGRATQAPPPPEQKRLMKLGVAHFYIANPDEKQDVPVGEDSGGHASIDAGYEYLYDCVRDRKCLVFSNSREETEVVTATLRQIARLRKEPDVFLIHHGNLSAAIREEAETKMKDPSVPVAVTCATVTMELGVDIGRLDRVAQMGAPNTVASFLQRLGRSGRRGNPPEMVVICREESPLPNTPLPQLIPWELLKSIAVIELYTEDRFLEPPVPRRFPFSLAFHQTLSIVASRGSVPPAELAKQLLSYPPFALLEREHYRELLRSMVEQDYLMIHEDRSLGIGLKGERVISSFRFYAVFKDSEDFTVRCGSEEIGTIADAPAIGETFALAGKLWEVLDTDLQRHLIFVKYLEGKKEISWPGDSGFVHTRILEKMREILLCDKEYRYLMPNAAARLASARKLARKARLSERMSVPIGGMQWVLFPWLGTRACQALHRYLLRHAAQFGISGIQREGCYYITFRAEQQAGAALEENIARCLRREGIHVRELVSDAECPAFDKFDDVIPPELLRLAFAEDRLNGEEVIRRFCGTMTEEKKEDAHGQHLP